MPHIGEAMGRSLGQPQSLGEGLKDLLVRSLAATMSKRDISGSVSDVKTAFSSWDNCMKATFCKWPVIAVIIVGGLIIFSVIWCIIRCACCGLSCCCSCFSCLKCCGCCGCCDPPKKTKYLDDPYAPKADHGYRSEAPMTAARSIPMYEGATAKPAPPQYAEFDMGGKKGNGDELPAMPSWDESGSKKVVLEGDAVELEQLKKPESAQQAPLMAPGSMSQPASPNPAISTNGHSPYGAPSQNSSSAYMATPMRSNTDPYGNTSPQGYNNYGNGPYGQPTRNNTYDATNQSYGTPGYDDHGSEQDYFSQGVGPAAGVMGQGRRTPHQDYDNGGGYGRGPMNQAYPQSRTPRPYDEYGRGTPRSGTPGSGPYTRPPPNRSPVPPNYQYGNPNRMQSPGPQLGYGSGQRTNTPNNYGQRTNTPNSYGRQYPNNAQRQYSAESARPLARPQIDHQYTDASYQQEPPQSPIQNSGGFDFTSGFARPQTASPGPQQQQANGGGAAYPGYRAYKPQS